MHRATDHSTAPGRAATASSSSAVPAAIALAAAIALGAPCAAQDGAALAAVPQEDGEVATDAGPSAADIASEVASARILGSQDPVAAWEEDRLAVQGPPEDGLAPFLWVARPVVVFADTPADPAFRQQMGYLAERSEALAERDVVVIADTDPAANSELRRELRPRGFMMVLVGKDGGVKLRKPFPWDVRELTRTIDKIPLRQQEVLELD